MANCAACGKKRPMLEVVPWREVEGALLCPDCVKSKENEPPADQARAAKAAGVRLFQLALPLSQTTGHAVAMVGTYASTTTARHASILDSIEAEGWRLEHAAYVYRVTGSVSRDKFLSSGQQEAVHGEIVGVYIFRAQ
jgi:hypothetical protein